MKRLIGLAMLAGVLGSRAPASAQAAWTFNTVSGPYNSLRGFQIDGPGGTDAYSTPYGFLFTLYGSPVWGYGMNKTVTSGTSSNDVRTITTPEAGAVSPAPGVFDREHRGHARRQLVEDSGQGLPATIAPRLKCVIELRPK